MDDYLSVDPHAGLNETSGYLSTDPNAGKATDEKPPGLVGTRDYGTPLAQRPPVNLRGFLGLPPATPEPVSSGPRTGSDPNDIQAQSLPEFIANPTATIEQSGGFDPAITIPKIPQQEGLLNETGAALVNKASGLVDFATSPAGGAVLLGGAETGMSRIFGAAFAPQMITQGIAQIKDAPTWQGKLSGILDAAFGAAGAGHATGLTARLFPSKETAPLPEPVTSTTPLLDKANEALADAGRLNQAIEENKDKWEPQRLEEAKRTLEQLRQVASDRISEWHANEHIPEPEIPLPEPIATESPLVTKANESLDQLLANEPTPTAGTEIAATTPENAAVSSDTGTVTPAPVEGDVVESAGDGVDVATPATQTPVSTQAALSDPIDKAAVKLPNGTIETGSIHPAIHGALIDAGENTNGAVDGFITKSGRFLTNKEAYTHATDARQIGAAYQKEFARRYSKLSPQANPANELEAGTFNKTAETPKRVTQKATAPEQSPTGIRNAVVDQQRVERATGDTTGISQAAHEARGSEVLPGDGSTPVAMIERGRTLKAEGSDPEAIASKIDTGEAISADETSVLRAHIEDLSKESNRAQDAADAKPTDPALKEQATDAFKAESDFRQRIKPAATEWQKTGVAYQGGTDIDTGSFTGLRRAVMEEKGRDITPKEEVKLRETAKTVQDATAAQDVAKAKFDEVIKSSAKESPFKTLDDLRNHLAERLRKLAPC